MLNRVRDKSQHSRPKVAESERNVEFVLHLAELVLDHSSNYEGTGAEGGRGGSWCFQDTLVYNRAAGIIKITEQRTKLFP